MNNYKVFIPTYGGGHVKIVIPIAKKLILMGADVVILALTASVHELRISGLEYKTISEYVELFPERDEIIMIGNEYIENNYNAESGLDKKDIVAYLGLNIWDLGIQSGNLGIGKNIFEKMGKKAFYPYNAFKKIISLEKPNAILTTCGVRSEKAAVDIASVCRIPAVRVVGLSGEDAVSDCGIPDGVDVCVINSLAKENIITHNPQLNRLRIYITGQPNLEFNISEIEIIRAKEELGITANKKIISFFSGPDLYGRFETIEKIIQLSKFINEAFFIYKLHPNEDKNDFNKYKNYNSDNFRLIKNGDSSCIVSMSDIVMTFFSTVGLQAIVANKPLITINLTGKRYEFDYAEMGYAKQVTDLENLSDMIRALLDSNSNESLELAVNRRDIGIPTDSAQTIAKLTVSLMENGINH